MSCLNANSKSFNSLRPEQSDISALAWMMLAWKAVCLHRWQSCGVTFVKPFSLLLHDEEFVNLDLDHPRGRFRWEKHGTCVVFQYAWMKTGSAFCQIYSHETNLMHFVLKLALAYVKISSDLSRRWPSYRSMGAINNQWVNLFREIYFRFNSTVAEKV